MPLFKYAASGLQYLREMILVIHDLLQLGRNLLDLLVLSTGTLKPSRLFELLMFQLLEIPELIHQPSVIKLFQFDLLLIG